MSPNVAHDLVQKNPEKLCSRRMAAAGHADVSILHARRNARWAVSRTGHPETRQSFPTTWNSELRALQRGKKYSDARITSSKGKITQVVKSNPPITV